jgi:hypothetical protein
MNVYLAEPNSRYDLSALEVYGPITYISDIKLNPFNTTSCLQIFKAGLKNFDSTEDYICTTGNMQIVALMLMIAYELFPSFKILLFDARQSNYKERMVNHV